MSREPRISTVANGTADQADRPFYKVDTATLAERRAHEQQAATELEQWKIRTVVEAPVAIAPEALALSEMFTTEHLREFERRTLEAQEKGKSMTRPTARP